MGLIIACKAFWKALFDKEAALALLAPTKEIAPPTTKQKKVTDSRSHLQLLAMLQRSGRLVDFLLEEIDDYDDAQVGAAARQLHRECRQCLEEQVTVRPLLDEEEGAQISIERDYDPERYRLTGQVGGSPPYRGHIVHRGWRACKLSLTQQQEVHSEVIAPAEVEIG